MKRLALGIMALVLFCGCDYSTYITNYTGTITVLDNNGNAVKRWDNITFQNDVDGYTNTSAFKMFGLNFYDPNSDKCVVISNAVPYIIEYNTTIYKNKQVPFTKEEKVIFYEERQVLIDEYNKLQESAKEHSNALSKVKKNSIEYNAIKESINEIKAQMSQIQGILWEKYNYSAY